MPIRSHLAFYNKKDRPWPNQRLKRAIIIGHTSTGTSKIWVRVGRPGKCCLLLSPNAFSTDSSLQLEVSGNELLLKGENTPTLAPEIVYSSHHRMCYSTDLTHVFNANGLEPNTRYYCAVFLASEDSSIFNIEINDGCSFKTLPMSPPDEFSFGLFSCHMPYEDKDVADAEMWQCFYEALSSNNARFLIGGGDQVYADVRGVPEIDIWEWLKKNIDENPTLEEMRSWYRDIYRGYWGFDSLQKVFASFPTYMTWDDHEIKDGWGSYTEDQLSDELDTLFRWEDKEKNLRLAYRMFEAAKLSYIEYQHSHNPDTDHGVFDFPLKNSGGDFYVLDARGCRDFEKDTNRILGREQTNRLMDWLEALQPSASGLPIFLVASIPFVHYRDFVMRLIEWIPITGGKGDAAARDHWLHEKHSDEINPIVNALFEVSDRTWRPLVILSGDVHVGTVFKLNHEGYPNAKVFQVTSSGITTYARINKYKLVKANLQHTIKREGEMGKTGVTYKLLYNYIQNNFGIIKLRLEDEKLKNLFVEIHGQSEETGFHEHHCIDLLSLPE